MCGSFCTLGSAVGTLEQMCTDGWDITPIMSHNTYTTDTRFGKARDFISRCEQASGRSVIHTIVDAEPIGPKRLLDALVIAPCTGNTLAKLACGVTDTPVTLAAKAHLRNGRPLILCIATNDALSAAAKNIGLLMNVKNVYFVPFSQDDSTGKPCSAIADFSLIAPTVRAALEGKQLQPLLMG